MRQYKRTFDYCGELRIALQTDANICTDTKYFAYCGVLHFARQKDTRLGRHYITHASGGGDRSAQAMAQMCAQQPHAGAGLCSCTAANALLQPTCCRPGLPVHCRLLADSQQVSAGETINCWLCRLASVNVAGSAILLHEVALKHTYSLGAMQGRCICPTSMLRKVAAFGLG